MSVARGMGSPRLTRPPSHTRQRTGLPREASPAVGKWPFDRLNPTDYSRDMGTSGTIGDRSGWSQNDQAADTLGQSGALEAADRAEIRAERHSRGQNRVMRVRPVSLGELDRRELG